MKKIAWTVVYLAIAAGAWFWVSAMYEVINYSPGENLSELMTSMAIFLTPLVVLTIAGLFLQRKPSIKKSSDQERE